MTRRWSVLLLSRVLLTVHTASGADKPLDRRAVVHSADTNADGRVDRVEFHQRTTEAFFLLDAKKDGFLTADEVLTGVQGVDPQRARAADRNRDGKMDIHAYHNALSRDFDAADTNGDGVLDAPEVERMWGGAARERRRCEHGKRDNPHTVGAAVRPSGGRHPGGPPRWELEDPGRAASGGRGTAAGRCHPPGPAADL